MTGFLTVIAAILIFAVMIFIHELGHFTAAKLTGIRVKEFAIGMGPKLWSRPRGETLYSIRAIPIGGFCAMEGEDTTSSDNRAITNKPAWVRLIVLAAGAFMNIVLGFVLLLILIGSSPQLTSTVVDSVEQGMPAQIAGLQPGDQIIKVNRSNVHLHSDILFAVRSQQDKETNFTVKRNGERITLQIAPVKSENSYLYGFKMRAEDNSVIRTLRNSWYSTGFYSKMIISTFFDLIRGRIGLDQLSGPIGIVGAINQSVKDSVDRGWDGFVNLLKLAILLTINLGIFNLLPIPALDGGRILFVLVEIVRRKPLPPEKEGLVHMIGFAAIILLSIVIAFQDIFRLW